MDDHRACRVTSVHTLSTTTEEDWKQQVQCCGNVDGQAQTLLLTRVANTTSTWRLSALKKCVGLSEKNYNNQKNVMMTKIRLFVVKCCRLLEPFMRSARQ